MFKREEIQSYYLHDTPVENVFINEFLPDAPGNYVKVFLFALMYADLGTAIDNQDIAKQLSLKIEEVLAAWTYWEEKGVIEKLYPDESNRLVYHVIFAGLKDRIFRINGRSKKKKEGADNHLPADMNDKSLKELYAAIEQKLGRILQGKEPVTIMNWIRDYGISKEYILYAFDYCKNERKNTAVNYVGAVIREWVGAGLKTTEDVSGHVEETSNRYYLYKRVMKALGFMRNPTEEEQRIMDVWFDDLALNINDVLEACKKTSGISNPNINYVNKVLTSAKDAESSRDVKQASTAEGKLISEVLKSYEEDRKQSREDAEERRREVYEKVPQIKMLDEEILNISMEISKEMLVKKSGSQELIRELKARQTRLMDEKAFHLTENNYRTDYMDMVYKCSLCRDEGMLEDGSRCSCFSDKLSKRMKELEKASEKGYNEIQQNR